MGTVNIAGQELIPRLEVPGMYQVSQSFVDQNVRRQRVQSVKMGRARYVVKASFEAYLAKAKAEGKVFFAPRAKKVSEQKQGFAVRTGARPCGECGMLILPDKKLARPETVLALLDVWAERGRAAGNEKIGEVVSALLLMREGGRKGGKVYCVPCAKAQGI